LDPAETGKSERASQPEHRRGEPMQTSARNQLPGTIKSIAEGAVMAEVVVDVNGVEVVAAITKNSVDGLQLAEGKKVSAIIKATDVMIATD
jgi:molybdate transport system regulatory protein